MEAARQLEGLIASVVSIGQEDAVSSSDRLPAAFIERNEVFRGVVLRDHRPEVAEAYARVDACLTELEDAVAEFPDEVIYDVANNVDRNEEELAGAGLTPITSASAFGHSPARAAASSSYSQSV